jgi:hypothetical protein
VVVSDPRVAADVLLRSDGQRFAWLVSQADVPVTVTPTVTSGFALAAIDASGQPACERGTITLDPYGTGVFRLEDVQL